MRSERRRCASRWSICARSGRSRSSRLTRARTRRVPPFSATVPGSRVKWRRGTPWGTSWRSTGATGSCSSRSRIWRRSLPTTPGRSARTAGETVGEALKELMRQKPTRRAQEDAYNRFVRSLKKSAWREVLRLTDVRNLASHGVQKEIDRILESNERMAFSEENVYALVESIFLNRGAILQQCVVEAFDIMTRYYDENRVHVEGWKTNDAWKVNRRVVLPRVVSVTFSGSGYLSYGNSRQNLNDIDRAMAFLEGKELESVPCTAVRALEGHLKACGDDFSGVLFESTYFEMRCYKKGTLHMYFKDKGLWERFNLTAARGKNWLPDDVKAREREARARNRRADQYGLPLSA
ncbi:DUF4942 domain-containing protein [Bilophila wadsworthia]|uniref:DUF4942 domain-containing protein n=1 Tax=Bilophila wadsworthia TaxID=35833 RepID=UPI0035210F0A